MSTNTKMKNAPNRETADLFLDRLYVVITIADYISGGIPYDSPVHKAALNKSVIDLGEVCERLFMEMGESGIHPDGKTTYFSVNDSGN